MHNHFHYLIIGSSLVLGACELEDDFEIAQPELGQPTEHESQDEIESGTEAQLRSVPGLDPDCAHVRAPIIARTLLLAGPCEFPAFEKYASEWEATRLFEHGSPMLSQVLAALPSTSPLNRFCRYDYIGHDVEPYNDYVDMLTEIKGPRSGLDGPSAATDCPVIGPMTDQGLDTAAGREALHEGFMANIHAVSSADLENVERFDTRLVLLDTVAEGATPYNEHGLQLESLIADIACPGDTETCMDWIQHVLVTPRVPEDDYAAADWDGGNVGYMHEFSMGLMYALLDWQADSVGLPIEDRERLIVSAAIGADPNHPIASDPTLAPAQSAIAALQAAYCMGAVVYAAAGNVSDSSCQETDMLAPASYEGVTVPTDAECGNWGYAQIHWGYTYEPGSPLIHAVGGLDGRDQPIANHRRDAHPRLHATSSDAISSEGTVTITGTSVATAVAAGTHLLMWSLDPYQTANEVVAQLYSSGYDTGEYADSGMYLTDTIHRLSTCHAVADLLDLECGSAAPDLNANLADYELESEAAIALADLNALLIGPGATVEGFPTTCIPTIDPFIKPQPERPACSHCNGVLAAAGNDHMLNMSIANQSWTVDLDVTAAYLHTYDAGGTPTTFNLGAVVPSINAAIPTNIIQVQFTVPTPASAVLEFVYYNPYTYKYTKQSNSIPLL
jgi:hypothetical protein